MENHEKIKKASRRSAILSISGFLIVILSLVYSASKLSRLEVEKVELEAKVNEIKNEIEYLEHKKKSLRNFLFSFAGKNNLRLLDQSVDLEDIKKSLNRLPDGKRKNAIINAFLLTWKDIPFKMGHESVNTGFDSPRFLRYVLRTVGLNIKSIKGKRLSVVLMEKFEKVDDPKPGDLVFFKGIVGNFGFILASIGDTDSEHVGIGALQETAPLQIISMGDINTISFPLKGYYRVTYPDEKLN